MSLSPDDFSRSIAIVYAGEGSVLVFADGSIRGNKPPSCDGWPLVCKDGLVMTCFGYPDREEMVYPPVYPTVWDDKRSYVSGPEDKSRELHDKIEVVLKKYIKENPDEVTP